MSGLRLLMSKHWSILRNGKTVFERPYGPSAPESIGTMQAGSTWVINYDLRLDDGMVERLRNGDVVHIEVRLTSSEPEDN